MTWNAVPTVLGIDPGLTGALVFYGPSTGLFALTDMPTHTRTINGKAKQELNLAGLADWLDQHLPVEPCLAYVEAPHAMPKQGVTSAFRFGFSCGAVQAMLAAFRIPYVVVSPAQWKRQMGVTYDKVGCQQKASQLLPAYAHHWPLKKHDGRAEAALLAYYGLHQQKGR